ncbi:MAG TPA: extracellular solute-binding protein [Lachnospiraceae bacterium]|nr:extracellular solute-binding protein [Lachnospiraceae bacterium]
MSLKTRLFSVLMVLCFLALELYFGLMDFSAKEEQELSLKAPKETIHIWYVDETLTDYLSSVALSFYQETDVRIVPVLVTGREYLESINEASLYSNDMPDMFIARNDSLGKAYLAGLASEIVNKDSIVNTAHYSQTALDAVTYEGKYIGYPFYFETSYLLYNKTYLDMIARGVVTAELEAKEDDEAALVDFDSAVADKSAELVPNDIEDILTFADIYDAPENVEAIFKWDVSDIFYNYFIVGNYMIVGGDTGDNPDNIDIYNENAINCLQVYQELNQFFSIDADAVDYNSVIQEFLEGKTIFTVATTDAIHTLEEAKKTGEFAYEYGVDTIPDIMKDLKSRSLSVTNAVIINGYSEKKEHANQFAKYLTNDYSDSLYSRTGKVSSKKNITYDLDAISTIMDEYSRSVSMPKMLETSNFWVQLELCFTKSWIGEDVNNLVLLLSEQIMTQVTGQKYKEVYVETPDIDLMKETEYIEDTQDSLQNE